MGGLCNTISDLAWCFLWGAAVFAVVETVVSIWVTLWPRKPDGKTDEGFAGDPGQAMDALAKVLTALKDLPAWVAIFLAGMALVWTGTSAPGLCT